MSEAQWTLTQLSSNTDELTPNTTSSSPSSPLETNVDVAKGASVTYVVEAESSYEEDLVHGNALATSTTVHAVKRLGLFDK